MKRNRLILLASIGGILVALSALTACGHWHRTPEERAKWISGEISEGLELNELQRLKLDHLVSTIMESHKVFHKDREKNRMAVLEMAQAETFDQQRTLELIREKTRFIEQQAPAIVAAYADLHNSLDPEQRTRIYDFLSEHFDYHNKWGHRS